MLNRSFVRLASEKENEAERRFRHKRNQSLKRPFSARATQRCSPQGGLAFLVLLRQWQKNGKRNERGFVFVSGDFSARSTALRLVETTIKKEAMVFVRNLPQISSTF